MWGVWWCRVFWLRCKSKTTGIYPFNVQERANSNEFDGIIWVFPTSPNLKESIRPSLWIGFLPDHVRLPKLLRQRINFLVLLLADVHSLFLLRIP